MKEDGVHSDASLCPSIVAHQGDEALPWPVVGIGIAPIVGIIVGIGDRASIPCRWDRDATIGPWSVRGAATGKENKSARNEDRENDECLHGRAVFVSRAMQGGCLSREAENPPEP